LEAAILIKINEVAACSASMAGTDSLICRHLLFHMHELQAALKPSLKYRAASNTKSNRLQMVFIFFYLPGMPPSVTEESAYHIFFN
jgi:hypothetical protein